jgi:hypothetical protein
VAFRECSLGHVGRGLFLSGEPGLSFSDAEGYVRGHALVFRANKVVMLSLVDPDVGPHASVSPSSHAESDSLRPEQVVFNHVIDLLQPVLSNGGKSRSAVCG